MASITTSDIRQYIAKRQSDSFVVRRARRIGLQNGRIDDVPIVPSNGEINRELTTLKRAFSLAIQADKLITKPHIPLLREDNVRTGFFEPEQYLSVIAHLPTHLRPVITFAYLTGWRIPSEVLRLEWRQIAFAAGEVRLNAGQTKNREAACVSVHALNVRALQHRERWRSAGRGHETRGAKWDIFRDWDKNGTTDRDRGDGGPPDLAFY